ncbi:hypothetical protein AusDCA_3620 [Desulfitobacterium sp. AusDCA]
MLSWTKARRKGVSRFSSAAPVVHIQKAEGFGRAPTEASTSAPEQLSKRMCEKLQDLSKF